jgi:hypothetical protein
MSARLSWSARFAPMVGSFVLMRQIQVYIGLASQGDIEYLRIERYSLATQE